VRNSSRRPSIINKKKYKYSQKIKRRSQTDNSQAQHSTAQHNASQKEDESGQRDNKTKIKERRLFSRKTVKNQ